MKGGKIFLIEADDVSGMHPKYLEACIRHDFMGGSHDTVKVTDLTDRLKELEEWIQEKMTELAKEATSILGAHGENSADYLTTLIELDTLREVFLKFRQAIGG